MTMPKVPTYARPGIPEGKWWHPLVYFGALFGTSALGWALLAVVAWFVWAHTLVAGSIIAALAVVTLCVYLAAKGNVRAHVLAAVVFGGLVVLVAWVVAL